MQRRRGGLAAVAVLTLVLAVLPARGATAATAGRPVSRTRYEPAELEQRDPEVATGRASSYAVWTDERSRTSTDVYGGRVAPDGTVLDPSGIPIARTGDDESSPAVAFNGTDYLVVWVRDLNGYLTVFGRRVSADGRPAGPAFPISNPPLVGSSPAVTSDGSSWFVIWGSGNHLYSSRVRAYGHVDGPVAVSTAAHTQTAPAAGFDGEHVVVAWQDSRLGADWDVFAARLSRAGSVLDPDGIPISTANDEQVRPAIASVGTSSLIVWEDGRAHEPQNDIYGARLARDGTVLDPLGKVLGTGSTDQNTPGIASDGSSYLVTWLDRDLDFAVVGKPVTASGDVSAPAFRLGNVFFEPQSDVVATPGGGFLSLWSGLEDVLAQRTDGTGRVGAPFTVSLAATFQGEADIAYDGRNHLVVWREGETRSRVYASRIAPDGHSLDPDGIRIVSASTSQYEPAVAFDGTNYLVVWLGSIGDGASGPTVLAARVTPAGRVLDPDGIPIATGIDSFDGPDVAAVAGQFVVVWSDREASGAEDVRGARIDRAGHVVGRLHIAAGPDYQQEPQIASAGDQALVVWTQNSRLRGRRLTGSRLLGTADGASLSAKPGYVAHPSVASDGHRFLVAWMYGGPRSSDFDVFATRVGTSGQLLDPGGIPVATGPGDQEQPAVAGGDGPYLVAWRDLRDGDDADVFATTVTTSGVVTRRGGQPVTSSPGHDGDPVAAPAARRGAFRLAWQGFVAGPPYGAVRVFTGAVGPT